jgi:hypothetical protein
MAEHMDERLTSRATDEGIDDVGELIALLGEMLDVLPKGLIGPLLVIVEIP